MGKSWVNTADFKSLKLYLLKHNIPPAMVDNIRAAFVNDAVREAQDMKYDRIYSGIALMLRQEFGFGAKRIMRGMRRFDGLCTKVAHDEITWEELMGELDRETGIVIRTDDENGGRLICEYQGYTYRRRRQIREKELEELE